MASGAPVPGYGSESEQQSKMCSPQWKAVFPTKISTQRDSLNLTRKMLTLALSSITYLRMDLPEECYTDVALDKLTLKILNPKEERCKNLCKWIKGAAHALEKGYLKTLAFAFFEDKEAQEDAGEIYTLHFEYGSDGEPLMRAEGDLPVDVSSVSGRNKLYTATKKMLRWVVVATQSMPDVDKMYYTIRLTYTDDTPDEYEPPKFKRCERPDFKLESEVEGHKAKEVRTPWHGINAEVKSKRMALMSELANVSVRTEASQAMSAPRETQPSPEVMDANNSSPGQETTTLILKAETDAHDESDQVESGIEYGNSPSLVLTPSVKGQKRLPVDATGDAVTANPAVNRVPKKRVKRSHLDQSLAD